MKAYVFVDIDITNPTRYEDYKKLTAATLTPYGGKFIVRGGTREVMEGEWTSDRTVVIEFPSKEKAKAWWLSDEYAPAKAIRQSASTARMVILEGYEG